MNQYGWVLYFCLVSVTFGSVTLNQKDTGFRGIWYAVGSTGDEYVYKYSGGLGTYCAKHRPFAVYCPEAEKTFFCYGGTPEYSHTQLLHMVSCYDHRTGEVALPTIVLDKQTSDAHDNPVISVDDEGYIWLFSTSHGTGRPSYIHKSKYPYAIDEFELITPTRINDSGNVVPMDNFSYFQVWHTPGHGFSVFFTRYSYPVARTICFMKSADGINWSKWQRIATIEQGSYQVAGVQGDKAGTAFNIHPAVGGLDSRTNLYYVETTDQGQSWHSADGVLLNLPLDDADKLSTSALIRDYQSEGLLVYMKDLVYDAFGNPVILYLTSRGSEPGPQNDPRTWRIAHWKDEQWMIKTITTSDNNYDMGSLYIESDGTWRLIAPTDSGPQPYNPGGEVVMWVSGDEGNTWTKAAALTQNSEFNHTYVRRPENAREDFYGLWADGHGRQISPSGIYYCNKQGNVTKLPSNKKSCPELYPEDITRDCRVDYEDCVRLSENWMREGTYEENTCNTGALGGGSSEAGDIFEDFEQNAVMEMQTDNRIIYGSPAMTKEVKRSREQSICWPQGTNGKIEYTVFDSDVTDCRYSVWTYIHPEKVLGQGYAGVFDSAGNYCLIVIPSNREIYYRFKTTVYPTSITAEVGWHLLSFIVGAQGHISMYFDDTFLATYTSSGGLHQVRIGKPWGTSGYNYFDCMSIVQDVRGGFCGDWNTIYTTGDFNNDCRTDLDDLASFCEKWLMRS
jgi:hypothetical protein